jgi:cytidylate kinase
MDHVVVTIARQYGSGGRTVGEMLARKLGIGYYDKEIIRMASDESGIDLALFGKVEGGMSVKPSLFNKSGLYKGDLITPDSKEFISDENLFNYQAKVIHDLADKESFVVIGRCVNHVLKDRPNTLRVFVHAPWDFRVEQASKKISGSREDVEKFLQKDDKRKQEYYRRFAGGTWNDATNYDLCLNSGKLGFDKCVEAIEAQLHIMLDK